MFSSYKLKGILLRGKNTSCVGAIIDPTFFLGFLGKGIESLITIEFQGMEVN